MRLALSVAALALLAAPACAQIVPQAAATPAPTSASPTAASTASSTPASAAASTPSSSASHPPTHHRLTMAERFANANTTHDGHLTLAQAKLGYPTVARHFSEIDSAKNGFVTEDDIRAWEKAERDKRHEAQQPAATPPKG